MDAKDQECLWAGNQTMEIIIQDDTLKRDMTCSLSKCFLPRFGFQENKDGTKQFRDCFPLMIDSRDIIGAVKTYIQEEKGIPFKKQKLLNEDGEELSDAQTLFSLGIKKGSTLILRYSSITQISTKLLMLCSIAKDPWSWGRSMQIIIHDDSYKDQSKGRSFSKSFVLRFGPKDGGAIKDRRISYTLMVEMNDTIAAIKAYIQEKTGFSFKKQNLFFDGVVLRDCQTLASLGIRKGSALILRFAIVFVVEVTNSNTGSSYNIELHRGDTVADVKAVIQEKTGVRFHNLTLLNHGQILANDERIADLILIESIYNAIKFIVSISCNC